MKASEQRHQPVNNLFANEKIAKEAPELAAELVREEQLLRS